MNATIKNDREQAKALRKVEIAIDKLIDVQDLGFGCDNIDRALELLNAECSRLQPVAS